MFQTIFGLLSNDLILHCIFKLTALKFFLCIYMCVCFLHESENVYLDRVFIAGNIIAPHHFFPNPCYWLIIYMYIFWIMPLGFQTETRHQRDEEKIK